MRVIGKRRDRPPGLRPPTDDEVRRSVEMADGISLWPRGLYRYPSHAEANADQERWTADAMARASSRLVRRPA